MKGAMRYLYITLCAAFLSFEFCCDILASPPDSPSLTEIVFFGLRVPKEIDQVNYPIACKPCVKMYLGSIASDSYLLRPEVPSSPDKAVLLRRRNLEAQIATILGQDVKQEAKIFAGAVPLMAEWEGMSEGPLDEANFVDNWLSKRSGTCIAPFLHLYKAHRLRAGYEAARARNEKGLWSILSKRYREALDQARLSSNPLISCIADDLEAQPYVYLEGYGRP